MTATKSAAEIKRDRLSKWVSDAAVRCYYAFEQHEQHAAHEEYKRAKAAYAEHCREFGLVAYATYDED